MMGKEDSQVPIWSYRVNLDKRVRDDHPLRRINAALDLSVVRKEVAHTYGRRGNKSVPPEVIVRMMLLLFLDDIKSERELMRTIPERLDYLWFLGFGLDDQIPDHSVLSKARTRWGREVFERMFVRTVAQCVSLGLVDGKKIHIDSSLVDADAARDSMVNASPELVAALRASFAVEESKFEIVEEERRTVPMHRVNFCKTDPDATRVARDPRSVYAASKPRYKSHRAVDDRCGVITAVETTPGHVR